MMSDAESASCPRCGAPIPAGAADQLCPACLMSGALDAAGDRTVSLTAMQSSPSKGDVTEFPCEFGGYRLLGLLGRGGMGTVYDAQEEATSRRVALKMLGHGIDSPEMRQRFLREGRLAAGVCHPNSLYIFGAEEIDGVPVITMEVAGSGTLKDKLERRGPLPVSEAVDAILDVIAGLEAAASAGVLHRDIKPSNCFVQPDGSVKIGDYGLSVSTLAEEDSYVTATGVIMGTPAYASPEQLRGDNLDVRADIYSVGATLFTLLTNRAPFDGDNAVQVVANAVNQPPKSLSKLRDDIPPGLEHVVARCLAKEPSGRYADYKSLRNALLPFSSREPDPASLLIRISAGWIDFLLAFLPLYVALMFLVGAESLLVEPLVERTLYSARYYFLLLAGGLFYFTIAEGIWGAGIGKRLKGLRVVRTTGGTPGVARGLIRIAIPVLCVEVIRMPLMLALIHDANWTGLQTALYVLAAILCGWIPYLLAIRARRENGFATVWDKISGTRVVITPVGTERGSLEQGGRTTNPSGLPLGPFSSAPVGRWSASRKARYRERVEQLAGSGAPTTSLQQLGPYQVTGEIISGNWIEAKDPVLRREVWLLRRTAGEPPATRRAIARQGRPRWLQSVETAEATWDAFEATPGVPYLSLIEGGMHVPWKTLRHWLHDLASEIWAAAGDQTLPAELSLEHVWISESGYAMLLDKPWPVAPRKSECVPVEDLAGQQRFLSTVAASVDTTSLPLHVRPVLKNLEGGKFEKLSFLTGTLRGLLTKPAEVSAGIRAASIFVLPAFVWIVTFIGYYHDKEIIPEMWWSTMGWRIMASAMLVLGALALLQLWEIAFRTSCSHFIFRLAVVDERGEPASVRRLLMRWMIIWLPLFVPVLIVVSLVQSIEMVTPLIVFVLCLLLAWISAAVLAVIHPNCGLHDRLAHTRVVRR